MHAICGTAFMLCWLIYVGMCVPLCLPGLLKPLFTGSPVCEVLDSVRDEGALNGPLACSRSAGCIATFLLVVLHCSRLAPECFVVQSGW